MGGLQIQPVAVSGLVRISYQDPSAAMASKIANAVGEAFIEGNLQQRYDASSYARNFLKESLRRRASVSSCQNAASSTMPSTSRSSI